MKNILKKHWIWTLFIIALLFPFAVYLFFLIDGPLPTGSGLGRSDWLSFIGSYASAFVALGAIAFGIHKFNEGLKRRDEQLERQAHVRKSETIYQPLYNELVEERNLIFATQIPKPQMPRTNVWGEIQKDHRKFDVPKELNAQMGELCSKIEECQITWSIAANEVGCIFNATIEADEHLIERLNNFEETLLHHVLENNEKWVYGFVMYHTSIMREANRKDIDEVLYEKYSKIESLSNLRKAYEEYVVAQKDTLDLLEKLIKNAKS